MYDALKREWQCGTIQLDMVLPERLNAKYVGSDNEKHYCVMLHRAILGSLERFIAIMIEHHKGHLPLWLAPIKMVIAPITKDLNNYASQVCAALNKADIFSIVDLKNEKINYKLREHSNAKIPLVVIVGKKEEAESSISFRVLGSEKSYCLKLDEFISKVQKAIDSKAPLNNFIS